MKKINSTYIDNLVSKIISETLEERADSLVSKIKSNVNELGGMDDGHPKFGNLNLSKMSDKEIEALLNKPVRGGDDDLEHGTFDDDEDDMSDILDYEEHVMNKSSEDDDYDEFDDDYDEFDDEEKWNELDEESEVCECGGGLYEGECMECGKSYMDEDINDVEDLNLENDFDYVKEEDDFDSDDSETNDENKEFCKYQKQKIESGDLTPEEKEDFIIRFEEKCSISENKRSMNERLKGKQKRIDKNKNKKIDAEDFRMLRKGGETDEQWQALAADMAVAAAPSVATWALDKAFGESNESKKKFPDLSGDGKVTRKDVLMGRGVKLKKSLKLSESEMIDLIEKIVLEDKVKSNIKNLTEPKGLTTYKRAFKGSGKENDDYIKSVAKKMKEYLKDGSKGDYETNPKHFPKGNGQLEKMKKTAYEVSKEGEEFLDGYMRPGMENLDYDEMHPNEDWMKDNIEGSSRTGNNPEWANAEETELGAKLNKKRKENKYAKAKRAAYNKSPQPVISDKHGQESGKGLHIKAESTEVKTDKKLNEEFEKMKSLISYDRKTQ
jgi:hypothetical protein